MSVCSHWVLTSLVSREVDLPPGRGRCGFQIAAQVRQLLEFRGQYCRFGNMMIGNAARGSRGAARGGRFAILGERNLPSEQLPFANQQRSKLRGATVFAG